MLVNATALPPALAVRGGHRDGGSAGVPLGRIAQDRHLRRLVLRERGRCQAADDRRRLVDQVVVPDRLDDEAGEVDATGDVATVSPRSRLVLAWIPRRVDCTTGLFAPSNSAS